MFISWMAIQIQRVNHITSCPAQDEKAILVSCERGVNTNPTHVLPLKFEGDAFSEHDSCERLGFNMT